MVSKNLAVYEPLKQTRSVLLYWRLPDEWAEVLHGWVCNLINITSPQRITDFLHTGLTFYEITDPPVESPLTGIPISLLRRAITILNKTGRAQIIGVADGEGVRFFAGSGKP
jgi:ESCRT-II complex subunit VPS25